MRRSIQAHTYPYDYPYVNPYVCLLMHLQTYMHAGMSNCYNHHTPAQLVAILDGIYSTFDELCVIFGVQKMETVGKTYMACAGTYAYKHICTQTHAYIEARIAEPSRADHNITDVRARHPSTCPYTHAFMYTRMHTHTYTHT